MLEQGRFFSSCVDKLAKIKLSTLLLDKANLTEIAIKICDLSSCPEKYMHEYLSLTGA